MEHHQVDCRNDQLHHILLARGKPQVLLFDNLDIVVHESDRAKSHRHNPAIEQLDAALRGQKLRLISSQQHIAGDHSDWNRDDKHKPAHDRRALFFLVPCRADIQDRLPEMDLVQKRNQNDPKRRADYKGNQSRQNQHCAIIHQCALPYTVLGGLPPYAFPGCPLPRRYRPVRARRAAARANPPCR